MAHSRLRGMIDLAQGIAFPNLVGLSAEKPARSPWSSVEAWQQKNLLLNGQEVFSSGEGKVPRRVAPLPIQDSFPSGRPSGRAIGCPKARAVRPVPGGSSRLGAGPIPFKEHSADRNLAKIARPCQTLPLQARRTEHDSAQNTAGL